MPSPVIHGESPTSRHRPSPEYVVWQGMRRRCNDENADDYQRYGGRGINVCERWNDFRAFLKDMGRRPSRRHQIERKENDVGYEPDNCVWATAKENARNRSSNRLITYADRTQCLTAWAEEIGCSPAALKARIDSGVSLEVALTEPIRPAQVLDAARDGRKLSPTRTAVASALSADGATALDLVARTGLRLAPVRAALGRLTRDGVAERIAGGKWRRCG